MAKGIPNSGIPRIRVGEPDSPVQSGDINPFTGGVYRPGQFAPDIDELATATFTEANSAGLLPNTMPIYDQKGEVSEDRIAQWNPNSSLVNMGLSISPSVQKHTAAVIVAAFEQIKELPQKLLTNIDMSLAQ